MKHLKPIVAALLLASVSAYAKAETYIVGGLGQSHYEWRHDGFWRQDSAPNPGSSSTRSFMWTLGLGIKTNYFPIELAYWDLGEYSNSLNFCSDDDYINTRCHVLRDKWLVHAEGRGRARALTVSILPDVPYTPLYARLGFARIKGYYRAHETDNDSQWANQGYQYKNTLIYGLGMEKSGYRVEYFRFVDASLSDSPHDAIEGVMLQKVMGFK